MSRLLHGNVTAHLTRLTLPSICGMFAIGLVVAEILSKAIMISVIKRF